MKPLTETAQQALLAELIDSLRAAGSWTGETHVQKCAFILKEALGVPLLADFTLYKHGPYSFDLRDTLAELKAESIVDVEARPPYGGSLFTSERANSIKLRAPKTIERYLERIKLVAQAFGDKGVAELERLGTALFVIAEYPTQDTEERVDLLCGLKPHVSRPKAVEALQEIELFLANAKHAVPSLV